eukprot:scaffold41572_cov51-Attheya_sp.AAC.2
MPIRVTFRVKWGSSLPLPVNERAKKQRTTNIPCIHVKSKIGNTAEEVTAKTEQIDDGSIACDHGANESALCEPSSDPHLSHSASTSSITSKQCTSQGGTSDNAEICAFEGRVGSDIDSLSKQDSESPAMNDVFSELRNAEELEDEQVAQSSTAHGPAAIPFVLNKKRKKKYSSWDDSFQELVDFKNINGHAHVPQKAGPLGSWVSCQRTHYRLLKEGKYTQLTSDKCEKLESIGFEFKCRRPGPCWDQLFQVLMDFKKINGHANVHQRSGPLGKWVSDQRTQYRLLKEGKDTTLTIVRREKLESIGFVFRPPNNGLTWDQRFQELVDFKKINGHTIVPIGSGPLGKWVSDQRTQYRLLKEGKDTTSTIARREKLESIGFVFRCPPNGPPWDQRFQELVDFKKINGHTNVPTRSGPLGNWVSYQRRHYRRLKEGTHSSRMNDKHEKLESIGFCFSMYKNDEYSYSDITKWERCKNLQH